MRRRQRHRQVVSRCRTQAALPVCAALVLLALSLGLAGLSPGLLVGRSWSVRVPMDAAAQDRLGAPAFWSVASWPSGPPPLALTGPQRLLMSVSFNESRQRVGLSLTPGLTVVMSALAAAVATIVLFRWLPPLSPAHGQLAVRAPPSSSVLTASLQ